jgi:hypothetical protein
LKGEGEGFSRGAYAPLGGYSPEKNRIIALVGRIFKRRTGDLLKSYDKKNESSQNTG